MARDYKSYTTTPKRSRKHKSWLLWVLLIMIIAISVGYGLYFLKYHHKSKPSVVKTEQKIAVSKLPDDQPIKFEFYTLLPKERVVSTDSSANK